MARRVLVLAVLPTMTVLSAWCAHAGELNLVAVVDLQKQSSRVSETEVQFLTDTVRKAAADGLDPARFKVLTRDSMEVLLPASRLKCLAGKCLAEIGRTLQAKFVVGGNVKDVGTMIGVTLEMYDSASGALLGSEQGRAAGIEDIVTWAQQTAPLLIGRILGTIPTGRGAGTSTQDRPSVEILGAIRPEVGRLRVEGSPVGSRLVVTGPAGFGTGGRVVTVLPFGPEEVPAGEYRIRVSAPNRISEGRNLLVRADAVARVSVDLLPASDDASVPRGSGSAKPPAPGSDESRIRQVEKLLADQSDVMQNCAPALYLQAKEALRNAREALTPWGRRAALETGEQLTVRAFESSRGRACLGDRDGDGVVDFEDECPNVPGTQATRGCPDGDHDGAPDAEGRARNPGMELPAKAK